VRELYLSPAAMQPAAKVEMPSTGASPDRMRPVRRWLYLIGALVALMVMVGGATRLTGAGLSITEWEPVTGFVPPLSDADWRRAFEKYQSIPQYQEINRGMSLPEFKFIYWWEWSHRALGRLLGVVFIVPLAGFWWRGRVGRALGWKLAGLFALGGLQGAVGWWMVASGLSERTDVSQYRLAIHLTLASVILAAIIAIAASLRPRIRHTAPTGPRAVAAAILVLVLAQIFLGALVAKTNAGLTFNTWPLIDGNFIPPPTALFAMRPWWKNFFENVLTVQFDHRMAAYGLLALAGFHAIAMLRRARAFAAGAAIVFALAAAQAMLGVLTLLWAAPVALALLHQFGAIAVLVAATVHWQRLHAAQRGAIGKS
jgi:heme a synthase